MRNDKEINKLVDDLLYIKSAINKSNNIFKFVSLSRVLRRIYLIAATLIIGFSGVLYYFIQSYGSYADIPNNFKNIIYALIALSVAAVAYIKITSIMGAAKKINKNITVSRLFNEVYTTQFTLIILPFVIAIFFTTAFLSKNDMDYYIVPYLCIFLGLLFNATISVFYMRELLILGSWLVLIGGLTIFGLITIHPTLVLIISFGIGFIIAYILSYLTSASEKEC